MDFYTDVRRYGNSIFFRGINNGKPELGKVKFQPTLYTKSKNKNSEWKSLYGEPLDAKRFDDINAAKAFREQYKDVNGMEVHGMEEYQYQFIAEKYPNDIAYDINQMKIFILDLEVIDPSGETPFPKVEDALVPIVLVSLVEKLTGKTEVFGWKDYQSSSDDNFVYHNYANETDMLKAFIGCWQQNYPHIYSGWNTATFDTPYLVNRIRRLLGDDWVNKLSPFGVVKEKMKRGLNDKEIQTYDIFGVAELDYLDLYKKFTFGARESFTLGFISEMELGETKLEIDSESFYDSYTNHYEQLVKYNAIDSQLVDKLDNKMKLFDLILSVTYMAKCNMVDVYGPVKTWDVFIYNYLLAIKTVVPPKKHSSGGEFEGAWVKEPIPGMYGWSVSFDAASLYPTIIRQWNMSPETYISNYVESIKVSDVVDCEQNISNYAQDNDYTVAANGTFYRKDKKGMLPALMEHLMTKRKIIKKEMIKLEQEYQDIKQELERRKLG